MSRQEYHPTNRDPLADTEFMFKGITAAENDRFQAKANAAVRRLFRRRVKQPDKLLASFQAALLREGFIRISLLSMSSAGDLSFRAVLGKKLKARIGALKHLRKFDAVYGCVIGAARRCGLDPRTEDVGVRLRDSRIEGHASAVPFIHQTRALDAQVGTSSAAKCLRN